jgi:hypothetical protein
VGLQNWRRNSVETASSFDHRRVSETTLRRRSSRSRYAAQRLKAR